MSVKRSGDVTAAAVVMFCGSAFLLLMSAFAMFTALIGPATNAPQGREFQMAAAMMVVAMYGGLAAWGIATGVGIVKLQPWARISAIVMSALAIAGCIMGMAGIFAGMSVINADNRFPPNFATIMLVAVSVVCAVPTGIAIWWVILFTRKRVALEFATRGLVPEAAGAIQAGISGQGNHGGETEEFANASVAPSFGRGAGVVPSAPIGAGRPQIPVSIRVIAVLQIVFSGLSLLGVPFSFMVMGTRIPILIFGFLAHRSATLAYLLVLSLLPLGFGIAILRRRAWSVDAMSVFLAAMVLNLGAFYISPARAAYDSALQSANAEMIHRMNLPAASPQTGAAAGGSVGFNVHSHVFQNYIFGLTMAIYVVAMFFLVTRRKVFREACMGLSRCD